MEGIKPWLYENTNVFATRQSLRHSVPHDMSPHYQIPIVQSNGEGCGANASLALSGQLRMATVTTSGSVTSSSRSFMHSINFLLSRIAISIGVVKEKDV